MLTLLTLKDFAVVSASQLAFSSGFTVVTGETGAGKSLLVDALLCLTGARADSGMVRFGAERAEISAEFSLHDAPQALAWLLDNAFDEQQDCQVRRIIRADGGSKAWINGRLATLNQLTALGSCLLEIHGQHEQQNLLERAKQLDLLDEFGQLQNNQQLVRQAFQAWQTLQAELDTLQNRGDIQERSAYLNHQLLELQQHSLEPDVIQHGLQQHKRQHQATQLIQDCSTVLNLLAGEQGACAIRQIRTSINVLNKWQAAEPQLSEALKVLESVDIQLNEALSHIEHLSEHIELDEASIQLLETQMLYWHELARKHRVPLEQLQTTAQHIEAELAQIASSETRVKTLQNLVSKANSQWQEQARALSTGRQQAATLLSTTVSGLMAELGMAGGHFEVSVLANEQANPQAHGLERCEFLVSANPGQPPRALRKVASGGELARISLAIEVATLGLDPTPSMIFDEVDSGIGGAIAEVVGQKLRRLGAQCQVLCVTHLAQVASLGHQHYQVRKHVDSTQTESVVQQLNTNERIEEIARMMGGKSLSTQTRAHAQEMLESANSG